MKRKAALWTINAILTILWICVLGTGNIGCDRDTCYHNNFQTDLYSDYPDFYHDATPDIITPDGIQVDSGGFPIDVNELDRRVNQIEECVLKVMKEEFPDDLTMKQQMKWGCYTDNFNNRGPLKRDCLIIKIVPPQYSKCSDWLFLDAIAPDSFCIAKGLTPTPECPCRWRNSIIDENILLTTVEIRPDIPLSSPPAPYLWDIATMMTGCTQMWKMPFAKCASF